MTKNQLDFQKNYETRRHNLELEKEQEYANLSGRLSAQAATANAAASLQNAATNEVNATIAKKNLSETRRHNLAMEEANTTNVITQGVGNLVGAASTLAKIITTFG